ncbi:MAG: acyltransferase [Thermoleophilaceae bacterium]|nr:acyltransferase [Thermoleophilaceae bacterium]
MGGRGVAEGGRFTAGDPLRGVAALALIVFHLGLGSVLGNYGSGGYEAFDEGLGPVIGRVIMHLEVGVYLFFALSGYLLFRPVIRAWVNGEHQPRIASYARNRALRIIPVFWVVVVITLLVFGTRGSSLWQILAVPLFVQQYVGGEFEGTIGQAWTLDTEIQFYAFLPLFALALFAVLGRGGGRKVGLVLGALALVFILSIGWRITGPDSFPYQRTLPAALCLFVPGLVLAALEQWLPARLTPARAKLIAACLLGVAVVGFVCYASVVQERLFWRAAFTCMVSGGLLGAPLVLEWARLPSPRVLDNRAMQWVGARAYPIYLLHGMVGLKALTVADEFSGAWTWFAVLMAITLPVTLVGADILHRFVEVPMLRLRSRPPRLDTRRPAVQSTAP